MVVGMVVKRAPKKYRKSLTTAQREVAAQNLVKAREWLKTCKEERSSLSPQLRKKYNKRMNDRFNILDVYVRNMEAYLKHGVWCDLFYGAKQEYKIKQVGV